MDGKRAKDGPYRKDAMLVLERREGQKIYIGNQITIHVHRCNKGSVRIGIDAPEDIEVWRDEVFDSVLEQKIKKLNDENARKSPP